MVKFGIVSNVDATLCRVRVKFADDGIVSHWLPVLVPGTNADKYFHIFDQNTHVACLMDSDMVNGVCMGAIYDSGNPANGEAGVARVEFSDGTVVSYDANESVLEAVVGTTTFTASPDGFEVSRGGESLMAIINDFLGGLELLTVPVVSLGNPSGFPTNVATFTALKVRLLNLFTA